MKMIRLVTLLCVCSILLSSCADDKTINGVKYRPYGFLNKDNCKNDSIQYQVSGCAVFSGIFFFELWFIPTIYTFGYNLWEPVGVIGDNKNNGVIGGNNKLKITEGIHN
jgi:hypothetical protein